MASTFTDIGTELMTTGENAGTWGTKTNTNIQILEEAVNGVVSVSVASADQTLSYTDGAVGDVARHAFIAFTGALAGNRTITVPANEKVWIFDNQTTNAQTLTVKVSGQTGVTWGASDKGTKILYANGTDVIDTNIGSSVGGLDLNAEEFILDLDGDTSITADTDDQIDIKIGGTDQIKLVDGAIVPTTDNDIDLGTSSLEFKDAYFDGTVTSDAFAGPLTGDVSGNVTGNVSGTAATVTTAAQSNITSLGTLTTLTVDDITINGSTISDAGDFTLDVEGDIILDANGADVFLKDAGTTYGSLTNSSGNLIVKSGTTTALTFSGANVTIAGDLTVSGDDITMGTNTAGNILVADGTNFNSVAVGGLSEISTVANDDVFLAVDTSGGGLKKIARSAVVSGLATSGAISNVVEDTSPQLGGNLDMNGADIVTTSNATIDLAPNGTGTVVVRGNTNSGAIVFNCESNSHGQKVIAQPHSASVTNVMLLPAGADSTLVSLVSTDTLTNKTLTSPKINEDVAVTSTATEINALDGITAVVGELNALDLGATAVGTAIASKAVILDSNKDYTGFRNITLSGELDAGSLDVSGDADIDGTLETDALSINGTAVTSTAAELNLLDGVSGLVQADLTKLAAVDSTAAELNIVDGGTSATGTTLVDADRLVANDAGTMVQVALSDVKTYLSSAGFVTDDPTALAIALG